MFHPLCCWPLSHIWILIFLPEIVFCFSIFEPKCLVKKDHLPIREPANLLEKAPWAVVNLDLPPERRFLDAYGPFAIRIRKVVSLAKSFVRSLAGRAALRFLESLMVGLPGRLFRSSYRKEMEGISLMTGVAMSDLAALNLFYELAHLCTSIVAEDSDDHIFHGRNVDFGVLLGWDRHEHGWLLTEHLRHLTLNLNFTRGGHTLFFGTTFAGHLGVLTGSRPAGFSVSINSLLRGPVSLVQWFGRLPHQNASSTPALWALRDSLEAYSDFDEARHFLSTVHLLSGCYFVLGGSSTGQGVVMGRNETGLLFAEQLESARDRWFLSQGNNAPGTEPLFPDGTRECLDTLGRQRLGIAGLLTVLSSKNTLNKSTVHSTVMNVRTGFYETYLQNCSDPCWYF